MTRPLRSGEGVRLVGPKELVEEHGGFLERDVCGTLLPALIPLAVAPRS